MMRSDHNGKLQQVLSHQIMHLPYKLPKDPTPSQEAKVSRVLLKLESGKEIPNSLYDKLNEIRECTVKKLDPNSLYNYKLNEIRECTVKKLDPDSLYNYKLNEIREW